MCTRIRKCPHALEQACTCTYTFTYGPSLVARRYMVFVHVYALRAQREARSAPCSLYLCMTTPEDAKPRTINLKCAHFAFLCGLPSGHIHTHTCMYIFVYMHTYQHVHIHIHVHMHVCMYMYMYVYVCTYTYMYITYVCAHDIYIHMNMHMCISALTAMYRVGRARVGTGTLATAFRVLVVWIQVSLLQ